METGIIIIFKNVTPYLYYANIPKNFEILSSKNLESPKG